TCWCLLAFLLALRAGGNRLSWAELGWQRWEQQTCWCLLVCRSFPSLPCGMDFGTGRSSVPHFRTVAPRGVGSETGRDSAPSSALCESSRNGWA
ncbi:unnamed protein product, partial [Closterium sp. NIES-54]